MRSAQPSLGCLRAPGGARFERGEQNATIERDRTVFALQQSELGVVAVAQFPPMRRFDCADGGIFLVRPPEDRANFRRHIIRRPRLADGLLHLRHRQLHQLSFVKLCFVGHTKCWEDGLGMGLFLDHGFAIVHHNHRPQPLGTLGCLGLRQKLNDLFA